MHAVVWLGKLAAVCSTRSRIHYVHDQDLYCYSITYQRVSTHCMHGRANQIRLEIRLD
jgi:hypothetical protein